MAWTLHHSRPIFLLSLKVALFTGTLSVVLGSFAAFVLVRYLRFSGARCFTAWSTPRW